MMTHADEVCDIVVLIVHIGFAAAGSDAQDPKKASHLPSLLLPVIEQNFMFETPPHIWPEVDHQKSIFSLTMILEIQYLATVNI